ncbi:DNA topology modulation protein [Staphylococcus shinii]|uniref:DNA topology modulation protein n=1 Tax=Staphylococcus shinii TaxID=2912228 RepID=A0A418IBU5_9STAP|nr:DNA topology modulation protein [Staphylococcus shinii]MBO3066068.1 DNA topology modulation protein [Staphylococcus shinii]MDW8564389.1 DNA topology modulation protein [Staphylococcus shinii]PKI12161.1 AAA family ATPase [Staphylococcus shinii]RIM96438.1 DNA topology modulation protein [Staphylococcus shinii]RIN05092.1 DNA topology modulation protein [Staphylococcus shinii]
MSKIIVIGSSGSGKSTLSRELSHILEIPVYHLDKLFWKPNWVMTTKDEQFKIQNSLLDKNEWIIDGNYTGILEERLLSADTIIFLNLPRRICYYRVFKRLLKNFGKTRIDMGKDCKERINLTFLKYIWNYPKYRKPFLLKKFRKLENEKKIFVLNSKKEIKEFKIQLR